VSKIDWTELYQYTDPNEAYNFFHLKITEYCDKYFKQIRLSRKCAKDKMWITSGIKKSSNKKNKLFKKCLCFRNADDEKKYKSYLKVF